jgi:hypothetical protein
MKRKDFTLVVKRFANLWYSYDPIEVKEKLSQMASLALTIDDGIFKRDSEARCGFIFFTEKLPTLVDAIYLGNLDTGGKGDKKKEIVKTTKLTQKQIKYSMYYVFDFFIAFPIKFTRIHLRLWLEALRDKEIEMSNRLEKNEIFAFFLFLHEFSEVSYLMLKYLKSLQKEDEKEKKEG